MDITLEELNEQVEEYMEIYGKYEQYRTNEKNMKTYELNIKDYMISNGIENMEFGDMTFTVSKSTSKILDRTLIPDIKKYYKKVEITFFRKRKSS